MSSNNKQCDFPPKLKLFVTTLHGRKKFVLVRMQEKVPSLPLKPDTPNLHDPNGSSPPPSLSPHGPNGSPTPSPQNLHDPIGTPPPSPPNLHDPNGSPTPTPPNLHDPNGSPPSPPPNLHDPNGSPTPTPPNLHDPNGSPPSPPPNLHDLNGSPTPPPPNLHDPNVSPTPPPPNLRKRYKRPPRINPRRLCPGDTEEDIKKFVDKFNALWDEQTALENRKNQNLKRDEQAACALNKLGVDGHLTRSKTQSLSKRRKCPKKCRCCPDSHSEEVEMKEKHPNTPAPECQKKRPKNNLSLGNYKDVWEFGA